MGNKFRFRPFSTAGTGTGTQKVAGTAGTGTGPEIPVGHYMVPNL